MRKRDPLLQKAVMVLDDAIERGIIVRYEATGTPMYGKPWRIYANGGKYYARGVMDVLMIVAQLEREGDMSEYAN